MFVNITFTEDQVKASVLPGLAFGALGRVIYIDSAAFAPDSDRDGIFDTQDNSPLVPNPDQLDTDNDGVGDASDVDDDNDGVPDAEDNSPLVPNPDQLDTDSDGVGNASDVDDDNDGVLDADDNSPLLSNPDQLDSDGDGVGDASDVDDDNDTVLDAEDACPLSDMSQTVVISGINSGAPNRLLPSGCTISDEVAHCAASARNHGAFVSCVAALTNDLQRAGYVTGQEKGAIQSAAARSNRR